MSLRRILVLCQDYPSATQIYASVFVHSRAKAYSKHAEVMIASTPNTADDWVYDDIRVKAFRTAEQLAAFVAEYRPDVIAAHYAEGPIITDVLLRAPVPYVVWTHGYEAMGFYRRIFNREGPRQITNLAVSSTKRLLTYRRLIDHAQRTGRGSFVVPSQWLLRVVQTDTLSRLPRAHVIPNPIDVDRFRYVEKKPELRTRVLLIRSFESRKYSTDVASAAIMELSTQPAFSNFQFDIYGKGRHFNEDTAQLRRFPNVALHERYVPHSELSGLHAEHGVMLCPTRQDTHGVTMCEAMSSGLVPVTTRNSAIPEFVTHEVSGLLTTSSADLARALLRLHDEPRLFARLSEGAAAEVRLKCALPRIIERELEVLEQASSTG